MSHIFIDWPNFIGEYPFWNCPASPQNMNGKNRWKKFLVIVLALSAAVAMILFRQQSVRRGRPTPMGLRPGMTVQELASTVGSENMWAMDNPERSQVQTANKMRFYLVKLAKPDLVSPVDVGFNEKSGLATISSIQLFPQTTSHAEVAARFDHVQNLMIEKYGKPKQLAELASMWTLPDGTIITLNVGADGEQKKLTERYFFREIAN